MLHFCFAAAVTGLQRQEEDWGKLATALELQASRQAARLHLLRFTSSSLAAYPLTTGVRY
jgi:hypothetical protein